MRRAARSRHRLRSAETQRQEPDGPCRRRSPHPPASTMSTPATSRAVTSDGDDGRYCETHVRPLGAQPRTTTAARHRRRAHHRSFSMRRGTFRPRRHQLRRELPGVRSTPSRPEHGCRTALGIGRHRSTDQPSMRSRVDSPYLLYAHIRPALTEVPRIPVRARRATGSRPGISSTTTRS